MQKDLDKTSLRPPVIIYEHAMPELIWKGKAQVVNHHHEVPFRTLRRKYEYHAPASAPADAEGGGSLIIKGDNLAALKALLPEYEGRVKCIYIDPPYNTGNEGWIYNDNVNDPQLKKWLGQVVGKEGEDLTRHDKWLCLMYPRLKLLHRLLADDGAIFISIDDNEQANLKLVMDEIFGGVNFVANIVWQKKYGPANDARWFSDSHDHILVFAKNKLSWKPNLIARNDKQLKDYKNPDDDPRGVWRASDLSAKTPSANCLYQIESPDGKEHYPPPTRSWIVTKERYLELLADNRIWFGVKGVGRPMIKKFLSEVRDGITAETWWPRDVGGDNKIAKYESKEIFNGQSFDTPKPSRLIERILQLASDKDSIILDSFAGSGTTAHAVLKLNQSDGGRRRFILVEMMDYAETITAERVRRVMAGYGAGDKAVTGTGGAFTFYKLGEPLFLPDGNLNETLPLAELRRYVAFTEKIPPHCQTATDNPSSPDLLGAVNDTAYFFYYRPDAATVLDRDWLAALRCPAAALVIYADVCLLDADSLQQRGVVFKKIPRDVRRF